MDDKNEGVENAKGSGGSAHQMQRREYLELIDNCGLALPLLEILIVTFRRLDWELAVDHGIESVESGAGGENQPAVESNAE